MSDSIPKKNKLFDKLAKNIHLDRLTRTPSPIDRSTTPPLKSSPSSKRYQVKPHNSNAILIPTDSFEFDSSENFETSDKSSNSGKEMLRNAFEVTMDQNGDSYNLHPLDQPITLGNGRKVYPISPVSESSSSIISNSFKSNETSEMNVISSDEVIKMFISVFQIISSIIIKFWNMDLNFNISISENSTMKIHIPTVVFSVVSMKVIFTLFSSNDNDQYTTIKRTSTNSNGGLGILTIIFIGCLVAYFYFNMNQTEKKDKNSLASNNSILSSKISYNLGDQIDNLTVDSIIETDTKPTAKPNIKSYTNNIINGINNNDSISTFESYKSSGSYADITPPISRNNSIGKKIEAKVLESKPTIDRSRSPIHRDRAQKKKHRDLHLPLYQKRNSDNNTNNQHVHDIDYMTRMGREKMLNAFT